MKSVQDRKKTGKNINTACNIVNLQSTSREIVHDPVLDSDLIIDINSDVHSHRDDKKSLLSSSYNFEDDVEKLIEVSKQFQEDYENEKVKTVSSVVVDDPTKNFNIQVLSSRSSSLISRPTPIFPANQQDNNVENYYFSDCTSRSQKENIFTVGSRQHNKTFTPKTPNPGPFGTGIIRPLPKKHSCVQKNELKKVDSCRVAWNIRPYSARYYNFDRTHPHLQLIENGGSIIPKRILKRTTQMTDKFTSTAIKKPLLNKGLTWHEFFERSNVYSAKSLQSSYGDCQMHTASTQTTFAESSTPKSNENTKIQKHVLPQLNIRAECSVQRIPEISIAPNALQHVVKSNIKLVEIIYGESGDSNKKVIEPTNDKLEIVDEPHNQIVSLHTSPMGRELNENAQTTESKISLITSSNTSLSNHGYDSSVEESISLNVSRVSVVTDHDTGSMLLPDSSIQNQKVRKLAKRRKYTNIEHVSISSSDFVDFEYDGKPLIEAQKTAHGDMINANLPTFPTNELLKMVDEIFDTSSDGCTDRNVINLSSKHVVKETSVQTDIVWENINEFLRQQGGTIQAPTLGAMENTISNNFSRPDEPLHSNATKTTEVEDRRFVNTKQTETTDFDCNILQDRDMLSRGYCRHSHMKKFKICSCLQCKSNIQFSVMNINQSSLSQNVTSSGSSSSAVVEISKPKTSTKTNLFPSERYKKMKQAQREHFESDPRISKTLRKIYATAKAVKSSRNETTSSSSSNNVRTCGQHPEQSHHLLVDYESLQPELYTLSDEVLLFGYSTDEIYYSSYLLKTESSQDTSTSNDRFCGVDKSCKDALLRNKLMCTNSEDSSSKSFDNKRGSDLERYLLKDVENSWSDPAVLSSVFSTSSLERKVNEIQLNDQNSK